MNLRNLLAKNYINLRGWKTNRKLVVIESDDWGSIRMKDKKSYNRLLKRNIPVDKSYFTKNDALETNEDIFTLQEILAKYYDKNKRNPIITLNSLVANPNFHKIKESNYQNYYYESITKTFENNEGSSEVLSTYLECIELNKFFKPQFHGREHINVEKFMNNLKNKVNYDIEGANHGCILGLTEGNQIKSREYYNSLNYMAGFEALNNKHKEEIIEITDDGLNLFLKIFGITSKSFVAQSLIWDESLLPTLKAKGVDYIQGAQQFVPLGNGKLKVVNKFTGNENSYNQILWRRNASFEPSSNPNKDWAASCLKEIDIAFKWKTPAIINSHRVNFIGSINKENRDNSIKQFDRLIKSILKNWPEVEFYSSDELGDIIKGK